MNTLPKLEDLVQTTSWNRRYRDMQELLHQGPEARKLIVDALVILLKTKDLSFGERRLFDQASNYSKYLAEQNEKVKLMSEYRK